MNTDFLGSMTPQQFITEYWQKKPLLIRRAFPGFGDALTPDELAGLACEEDAQSRLVLRTRGKWALEQGPFDEARFARLPDKGWSLLVQGVNHFLPAADALLHRFDFIPQARLDDVMVSLAPDGGGVGPHFDSYDVFLLQGRGQRLWRVSSQQDTTLVPGAPLRILQHFHTEQEWLLEPGDMLYLPPRLAHWGIAVGECMTWSVGFRAPSAQELGTHFLDYLRDTLCLDGMYADPDLAPQTHPAEISVQMCEKVAALLRGIRWDDEVVADFIGAYLTEPKPHVVFSRPRSLGPERFREHLSCRGVRLDPRSGLLFRRDRVFMNGEAADVSGADRDVLVRLADQRGLPPLPGCPPGALALLRSWYAAGYLDFVRGA